ncbi:MAG: Asp-tRNA(Asn)/Glu-tRNA(Gln) amidotransferase subunit GatC [Bdellovibrionales bacterium]|nr:Asp-tRNA(Asn)/Glu-tRNA(Gln) amidotransferase subunit GatC [Oligoflexia bacterium]
MIEVNEALILKVAELSRLELNEREIQNYVESIGDILKHVDQLSEVNVDGVEPMYYGVDDTLRLREDQVIESDQDENCQPKVLKSAPEVVDGGYKVPQIIG